MPALSPTQRSDLEATLGRWSLSPLAFVREAFPWGQPDTALANHTGPHPWQIEALEDIEQHLRSKQGRTEPLQLSTASGHGVGKSALASWLILWAICTYPETRGVVTANTEVQLRTKTWAELAKWHNLLVPSLRSLFDVTATAVMSKIPGRAKTWRIDAIPWSESNTEAFAGLHNAGKRILVLFDEASAIHNTIWEVTEGALTDADTEILWVCFGNPTRTAGRFADTWGRFAKRWKVRHVDSRTVPGVNLGMIQKWLEDWGEDSDFFRVRVRGLPPKASASGLYDADEVSKAQHVEAKSWIDDPLVMSVDVARGGEDECVIAFRRGMDARTIPWVILPGSETRDSMRLVNRVVELATVADQMRVPDAIIVDETGVGGPIVDRLRQLLGPHFPVFGVNFASKSPEPKHANIRMTMHWRCRDAFRTGLAIPLDPRLEQELMAIEYLHDRQNRLLLVPKDDLREELGFSPDRSDALALSFAVKVEKRLGIAAMGSGPIMIRKDAPDDI